MALHSKFNNTGEKTACGLGVAPIRNSNGAIAPKLAGDGDDIIDEAIKYFRPNLLFKNFDLKGPCDLTLIYLTVYIQHLLKTIEKEATEAGAKKKFGEIAREAIPKLNDKNFFMGGILKGGNDKEYDLLQNYLKICKEEVGNRLLKILYDKNGKSWDFKFWVGFGKRKFMNYSYTGL